jgi:acetoin utilization deacetylase AcuC-like enzyme
MLKVPVPYSDDFAIDYDTVDCESPHRAVEIWLKIQDMVDFVTPPPCSVSDLLLCHSPRIVEMVEHDDELFPIARRAAGGAIMAARYACEGAPSFALVRPPGHHAGFDFNGGFCFFNNMAIAVRKLLSEGLIARALIVDIDLHYGNGTFDIFKDDTRITFRDVSASTRDGFLATCEDALKDGAAFDLIGCSAGFDTYFKDWGALLLEDDYRRIGRLIASSNPHSFSVLEGGYYINDLGLNVRAYLKGVQEACS